MTVSLIIPTYNAQNYLASLLERIGSQSIGDCELIIIDSSSVDKTVEIAKQYTENVIVIPQGEFDHGGTRAKAAQIAKGEILVYMTQDALPCDNQTIENIVKVFENEKVGAAYGRQLSYEETNLFGKHLREFNYPAESYIREKNDKQTFGIKTVQLSNSFAAYRKDVLMRTGSFKDGLILGEDVYTGARILDAGYSLAYVAEARVYHSHSYTIWQEFKRYFDIGVFHRCESWILDEYGKAEGEGGRYVRSELKYLAVHHAYHLIPAFFMRNAMKYLGYKLGQNYTRLPHWLVKKLSMHHRWWDKKEHH